MDTIHGLVHLYPPNVNVHAHVQFMDSLTSIEFLKAEPDRTCCEVTSKYIENCTWLSPASSMLYTWTWLAVTTRAALLHKEYGVDILSYVIWL